MSDKRTDDPKADKDFLKVVRHFLHTPKSGAKEEPKSSRPNDRGAKANRKSNSKKKD